MPFTFSHPAAVLPLLRRDAAGAVRGRGPLSAAGLVAGSLAPDVPFFVASPAPGAYRYGRLTHHPVGVVLVDPLIAAVLAGGWRLVRGPLTGLLPPRAQGGAARLLGLSGLNGLNGPRGEPERRRRASRAAGRFLVSAAVGAAGHAGWDAFTHHGRRGVRLLPVLDRRAGGVPLHHWAQYAFSAAGLVVLGISGARVVRTTARVPVPPAVPRLGARGRHAGAAVLGGCALAGVVHRCLRDHQPARGGLSGLIASVTFGAGAGLALAAVGYATVLRAWPRPSPRP